MKIDLFKYILKVLLILLMCVALIMLTEGNIDNISSTNVMGFILTIVVLIIIIIINSNDKCN
nr:MAG TPA: hypothetical protein [Crassvirales sp.]